VKKKNSYFLLSFFRSFSFIPQSQRQSYRCAYSPSQLKSRKAQLEEKLKEQEELEKYRQDPISLNPDQESRKRLQALTVVQQKPKKLRAPIRTAQDELAEIEAKEAAERAAKEADADGEASDARLRSTGRPEVETTAASAEGEAAQGEENVDDEADPLAFMANMTARERKLYQLQQRLQQCRKLNQSAVVDERKREQKVKLDGPVSDSSTNAKRKWFEEKKKKKDAELERLGLTEKDSHRLESIEHASLR
jgi:pre-mRNA-splicing factor SYF2